MVAPLVIAAGAAIVGGIMQWAQSEKARGATNDRLRHIEEMFNAIVPPDYDISIWDSPKLAATIPEPSFNWQAITPEQYQQVATFQPELADFIAEKAPELPKITAAAASGRDAQLSALSRYRQIAAGENDPELQQMLTEASQKASRDAQSRQASVLQDASRRGQLGSTATLAAQMQSGSDAMSRQASSSMAAAAEGYRNRLRALDQSASLGGDIHASEMGEQSKNAQIINDANQRATQRYQSWLQGNADTRNQASRGNLDQAQRIADANVAQGNKYAVENQGRYNQLAEKSYGYRKGERDAAIDREKYKNSLKQQGFENDMSVVRGKAGIAQSGIDYLRQDARDSNQNIQGTTAAIGAAAMYGGRGPLGADKQLLADPTPQYGGITQGNGFGYASSSPYDPSGTPAFAENQSREGFTPYKRKYSYDDWVRDNQK